MSHYCFYDSLISLPVSDKLWQKIIMNFIVKLLSSKHKDNVYNSILIIMNQYIKMVWYLSTNIIIKSYELGNLLMEKIFLCNSGTLIGIISDRNPVFISDYWLELYYHIKIKQ